MAIQSEEKTKVLCYVETPLQVFSLFCLFFTNDKYLKKNYSLDCLIGDVFKDSHSLAKRLEGLNIFENVWVVTPPYYGAKRFGLKFYSDYFFYKKRTKKWFFESYPMFENKNYDEFVFAVPLRLLPYLKWFCGIDAKATLIEDGVGSYDGDMFNDLVFLDDIIIRNNFDSGKVRIKRFLKKILKGITRDKLLFHPEAIYLFHNNETLFERYKNIEIRKNYIPKSDESTVLSKVFPIGSIGPYKQSDYVFLSTADLDDAAHNVEVQIINAIDEALDENLILRKHPRETRNFDINEQCIVDEICENWEMLCWNQYIDGNNVLFSICSTAQINPKIFFNAEPYIVFLYNLFPDTSEWNNKELLIRSYDEAMRLYDDTSKVYAPESLEELQLNIECIKQKKLKKNLFDK